MAMAYEHKDMTGSIFVNEDKKGERHPDWRGKVKINGEEYYAAGWNNESRNGPYISMKFESVAEAERNRQNAPREGSFNRQSVLERNKDLIKEVQRRAQNVGRPVRRFDSDIPSDDDIPF